MRSAFVSPGASISYFHVTWKESDLSWEQFRASVIGATDPNKASEGSIRGQMLQRWQELGLASAPSGGENGVHGSASPLEGLAERCNWMGLPMEGDPYTQFLCHSGELDVKRVGDLCRDCQVVHEGKQISVFDLVEETDAEACRALLVACDTPSVDSAADTASAGEVAAEQDSTDAEKNTSGGFQMNISRAATPDEEAATSPASFQTSRLFYLQSLCDKPFPYVLFKAPFGGAEGELDDAQSFTAIETGSLGSRMYLGPFRITSDSPGDAFFVGILAPAANLVKQGEQFTREKLLVGGYSGFLLENSKESTSEIVVVAKPAAEAAEGELQSGVVFTFQKVG